MAGVDRISELPEPILHHILSFLSQKEAIQTSALSKTWRHVGPTRPKIELRERCFPKSGDASFLSVLGKTLQRYNHRNLSVHEFILEMSWLNHHRRQRLITDPEFFATDHDHDHPLFKGLKRLSLTRVHIKAETLEKIIQSSPLMEYLLVSNCFGLTTIPETIFQAEFLTELYLSFTIENLIFTAPELILIKRLKTLSLGRVCIAEETLEKIMCSCPLIEDVLLFYCVGLTNIQLNKNNNNLKSFSGNFYPVKAKSFEIAAPNIETIRIVDCPNWYGHDKYFFPRLKTLYLQRVKLSAELFESFSSNFHSLEDLELEYCYGFQKIQLTVCSIKRLVILYHSFEPVVITIYAPNIHYFRLSTNFPPQLIIDTETTKEWESHVVMLNNRCSGDKDSMLSFLRQLSKLLNSISESQISLGIFPNLKVENRNDAGFCKPVPLEHVSVKGGYYDSSSFPDFLNCLFLVCRPRYVVMDLFYTSNTVSDLKKEKDKLAKLIKLLNKGKMKRGYLWGRDLMKRGYLWGRDLKEISMQVWDENSKGWHTVGVEGPCFPSFRTSYPRIRYSVKWRD